MVMLFVARGTMAGVFQVVYLYTPEVYPTNLRAVAYGKNILTLDMSHVREVQVVTLRLILFLNPICIIFQDRLVQ